MLIFKSSVLFGLLAICHAAPWGTPGHSDLERRIPGSIPASVNCAGVNISRQRIEAALRAAYTPGLTPNNKQYPAYYGNKDGVDANGRPLMVLTHPAAVSAARAGRLQEQPLGLTGTWTNGRLANTPGAELYRVIFNSRIAGLEASYVGVVYHPPDRSNRLLACSEAAASPSPSPSSTPAPTPSPTPTPTPTPTPKVSPTPKASPTSTASPILASFPSPTPKKPAPKKPKNPKKPSTK